MFFPDRLKISKIIPIFKSDNASLAQNYRPISILPAFSKIFERAVYNRIFQFSVNSIRFSPWPLRSNSRALIIFVNKVVIYNAFEYQKYLAGIFQLTYQKSLRPRIMLISYPDLHRLRSGYEIRIMQYYFQHFKHMASLGQPISESNN